MSDTTVNRFLAQGTNAERLAFTPVPPTPAGGPDNGYLFFETDTGNLYAWDTGGAAWVQVTSGTGFTNPMTTSQDLIVGGVAGAPGRLGVGAVGRVLTVGSGGIVDWEAIVVPGGAITASGYTMATARVLGRDTASTGAIEELTVTGTGSVVKATSPTLVTPALGTPTALVLTNATGLPVASGISGLGTGVATALAVNVGSAGAPIVFNGALGTPSSGTLTNATGLPLGSITGLGANMATFLATPSSANLAATLTDKTGTGLNVFGTAPTFASTMTIGTAAGTTGAINFVGTTSGLFTMTVAAAAGTWTATWPATAGSNTNVLTTNGSGVLSWAAAGGGGGTVNSGTATNLAYYATTGTAVSETATISVSSTGRITFSPTAISSLATAYFLIQTPADTGLTASTEAIGARLVTATRTWATTGTVALQREVFFGGPTYASASASQTFTDLFTLSASPPIAGTNAIFTRNHTFGVIDATVANSSITGGVIVAATVGTSATSVGIGGGKVFVGATVCTPSISDTSSNLVFSLTATGSAVNYFVAANAATGSGPTLTGWGTDTNVDLNLAGRGLGGIVIAGNINAPTLRVGALEMQSYTATNCAFGGNLYFDGTNVIYRSTGAGSYIQFNAGQILLRTAPSGTGGTTATVTTWATLAVTGELTLASSLKTGAPSGGTAAFWKFGVLVTGAVIVDTTRYIQLDVGGTLYKVIIST